MTTTFQTKELQEVSAKLLRARSRASALPGAPSGLPDSLQNAYLVQDLSIAAWHDYVAGWKVGGVPVEYQDRFQASHLAGPIFHASIKHYQTGSTTQMPVFAEGFSAIEPEFVFRLGKSRAQDRLFIGAEIASSPIPRINDYGPVAVICDFGNNNGLLVGNEIFDWRTRSSTVEVRSTVNERVVGERVVSNFPGDPIDALEFLRELAAERGIELPEGTYVSSGAITGIHEAGVGARATLDFGAFGSLQLELVAAQARTRS